MEEKNTAMIHVLGINDRLHLYPLFQWAAPSSSEPLYEGERDEDIRRISPHYHFKCSGSEADEGGRERKNKRGASERGRKRASGLSCAEARLAKLNEHQICTVSAGWVGERDRMVSRAFNYCKCTSVV